MITLFQLLKFICIFENGYLVSLFSNWPTRVFKMAIPFKSSAHSYVKITGDFQYFQGINFATSSL